MRRREFIAWRRGRLYGLFGSSRGAQADQNVLTTSAADVVRQCLLVPPTDQRCASPTADS
jgi:hypothetical protein